MNNKARTTGTKAKPAVVPKLRFPEFRNAAGWKMETVGPYLEDCSQRVPSQTELPVYSSTREGLKRQDNYFDGRVLLNENDYGVVPQGCFVYRHMSDDGTFKFNINQTGGDIAVSKEYPVFTTKGLNALFMLAKLNEDPDFKQFALSQKAGGTRTRLYFSRLCEWQTLLPQPPEQKRIANCLSAVDELISAQARKLDALKTHKKGLMQQLFPREGETQPRLRFPEFQRAAAWKEKPVGSSIEEYRAKSTIHDEFEVMTSARAGLVRQRDYYDNDRITERDNIGFNIIPPNYLTYRSRSDDRHFYFNENTLGITGIVSIYYPVFRIVDGSNKFFIELLSSFSRVVGKYAVGTSQTVLSMNQLSRIKLPMPEEAEQQRIAECLTSLDDLIAAEAKKLDAVKAHKKGLMQQLFPSPQEPEA